jgi:hypothetical protein
MPVNVEAASHGIPLPRAENRKGRKRPQTAANGGSFSQSGNRGSNPRSGIALAGRTSTSPPATQPRAASLQKGPGPVV